MTWNLALLYPGVDSKEFLSDLAAVTAGIDAAQAEADALTPEVNAVEHMIMTLQGLMNLMIKVDLFVSLTLSADANDENALAHYDTLMKNGMKMEQVTSTLSRILKDANIDALAGESALISEHRFMLEELKKDAMHVIDPTIEGAVLKMQLTGGRAWEQLRDQVTSNLTIPFERDGKTEKLPLSEIRGLAYSPDAEVRERAYQAELAAYPEIEIPIAACLNGIKGEAHAMCAFRNYDSVIDMSLATARMDRETLDALIASLYEALPMFRRYFRLKARILGYQGGLKFSDLFAPVGSSTKTYTLEEAREALVTIMRNFSDKMADFIDGAFENRWIDAFPRPGKQGGAFCAGAHPIGGSFVLSNFDGSLSSVGTLAHELGHAYHNFCMKDASVLMADYPMPLAETASIFNETLLVENMLRGADDETRLMLLDQQMSDAAQVIVDILSRYIFESEVVEKRKDKTLSPKELCEIMKNAQLATYGDGLDPDHLHPYMWANKSHYYSTGVHFYNFPYAFGLLFGTGVYARYLEKGDAFLPEYDALLASTGSGDVRTVAKSAGIDVTSPDFWRSSVSVFEKKLAEMEQIVGA